MGAIVSQLAFQPPPPREEDLARLRRHRGYAEARTASGAAVPLVCCTPSGALPEQSPCLLFSHGNAEDLGEILPFLAFCTERLRLPVVGFEYPGYGAADGEPSERGCYEAADAAFAHIRTTHPGWRIVLFGRSLGSGPACYLAERVEREQGVGAVAGLVLLSPLCSAVATQLPGVLARLLRPIDLMPNLERLPRIRCPVVVLHGTADRVVPCSHGRTLHARAHAARQPLWVRGAGHNDVPEDAICDHIARFVEEVVT